MSRIFTSLKQHAIYMAWSKKILDCWCPLRIKLHTALLQHSQFHQTLFMRVFSQGGSGERMMNDLGALLSHAQAWCWLRINAYNQSMLLSKSKPAHLGQGLPVKMWAMATGQQMLHFWKSSYLTVHPVRHSAMTRDNCSKVLDMKGPFKTTCKKATWASVWHQSVKLCSKNAQIIGNTNMQRNKLLHLLKDGHRPW